ncbi:MAG: histidinol-phosphatase [Oscillospiraceae bacterium]|nr:histidinol-phosphatase [Oscillospiraceae bacterium]
MKVNLHTHTYRCNHAHGTDEEYVLAAINCGYTKLGFSDHTPFPYKGYVSTCKMAPEELAGYIASVQALKEKYQDQIEIVMGLECEVVPEFFPFLREMHERMDYLILGNHGDSRRQESGGSLKTPEGLWKYVEVAVTGLETGLFLYLAHPDLMLNAYPVFDTEAEKASRALCREANRLNIPMEYNLYGVLKGKVPGQLGYPCEDFWRVAAEENVRAVIGVDAHAPEHFAIANPENARSLLEGMGITVLEDPMRT